MTLVEDDIRAHSVQRDDATDQRGNVLWLTFPQQAYSTPAGVLPIDLPMPWSRVRDRVLLSTVMHETMWAAAVQKVTTRVAALGFTVDDQEKSEHRTWVGQQRLLQANLGKGWVSFMTQFFLDFLLTDNGAFVELIYRHNGPRSQFLGFAHLDSVRCTRTGDPEIPVVYEDLQGRVHELRAHQVLTFVDMESGRAEARGTGLCAASRAYHTIHKLAAMERYVDEKITGSRPLAIHLVNGISSQQMQQAVSVAKQQQLNQGAISYMGTVIIPATKMDAAIGGYKIPIAEVPDGFDAKEERSDAYSRYAAALGIPSSFLVPLSGQGLGTGKQSEIQDDTADEFGVAAALKQWEHIANQAIMPSTTTFSWTDKNDARKQLQGAQVSKMRAETRKAQIEAGEISPAQSLQMAADAGDVPDSFLPDDETPNDQLSDSEKRTEETSADTPAQEVLSVETQKDWTAYTVQALEDAARTLKTTGDIATKARRLTLADIDDAAAMKAAQQLYEKVKR